MSEPLFQRLGRRASQVLGRDSAVVRALRPAYEWVLDLTTGGRGFARLVNGRERFFVNQRARGLFPEVYEPAACAYLRERVKPGAVALNIGAHVGIYALCLAEWSKPGGHVHAFEPNPATRAILEDHVRRNGARDRITVEPRAVGGAPGSATLSAASAEGYSRLGEPNPEGHQPHRPIQVEVTTVDAFCAERRVKPDWIVMDIEGFEVAALRGAKETIRTRAGRLGLVVEMHPHLWGLSGSSRPELEALLDELGLEARGIAGQQDPLGEPGVVALVSSTRPAA